MQLNFKKGPARIATSKAVAGGFTLIELLVVVAIIGILSAVVLASLNSGRTKGKDASVKSNLVSIRSQAEIFSSSNNNSYLPSGSLTIFDLNTCPTIYNPSGTDMLSRDKAIFDIITEATNSGGNGNYCYNSSTKWAVAVGLKSDPDISWCVDSTGASLQILTEPVFAIHETEFVCTTINEDGR